jgi:hypothetical protein
LNVLSNCFEKQMSEQRKLTSAQNGNEDVRRTSSGRQDPHHSKIHTCLPYTSLEATFYPDRQESQYTGLHYQPQEQAVPDFIETLDGLSSAATTALRKNLLIYPTRRRTFQLYPIPYRAWAGYLRPTIGERVGFGGISASSR